MASRKPIVRQAAIVRAFAERLRSTRTARAMTQRDLAEKAQVTFSYISRLEAGGATPGIDLLERLAQALGVGIGDLLPSATDSATTDDRRDEVKALFVGLLPRVGPETLSMLKVFLTRLAESSGQTR